MIRWLIRSTTSNSRVLAALVVLGVVLACSTSSQAADAYVLSFNAVGRSGEVGSIGWSDNILFYNNTTEPVTVRLLGVSNGPVHPQAKNLTLPPRRVISKRLQNLAWRTSNDSNNMTVLHLDIPEGVIVESRSEAGVSFIHLPLLQPSPVAKVSMPVYRELVPPGHPQVHLGTDLHGYTAGSRINVAVYNGGDRPATATIELRRSCDDVLVDSRTVSIPPNTVIQIGGLLPGPRCPAGWLDVDALVHHTTVSVSEKSLSWVTIINDTAEALDFTANIAPIVGMSIVSSERF